MMGGNKDADFLNNLKGLMGQMKDMDGEMADVIKKIMKKASGGKMESVAEAFKRGELKFSPLTQCFKDAHDAFAKECLPKMMSAPKAYK